MIKLPEKIVELERAVRVVKDDYFVMHAENLSLKRQIDELTHKNEVLAKRSERYSKVLEVIPGNHETKASYALLTAKLLKSPLAILYEMSTYKLTLHFFTKILEEIEGAEKCRDIIELAKIVTATKTREELLESASKPENSKIASALVEIGEIFELLGGEETENV